MKSFFVVTSYVTVYRILPFCDEIMFYDLKKNKKDKRSDGGISIRPFIFKTVPLLYTAVIVLLFPFHSTHSIISDTLQEKSRQICRILSVDTGWLFRSLLRRLADSFCSRIRRYWLIFFFFISFQKGA